MSPLHQLEKEAFGLIVAEKPSRSRLEITRLENFDSSIRLKD